MRALFTLIAAILLVVVVWLGARYGDRLYCRMILNKATHEFLTQQEDAAIKRATGLLKHHPDYRPALESAITWLAADGAFLEAWALARDYATTESLSPAARYQLATCAYEKGDERQATGLFESLTTSPAHPAEIPQPLVNAYLAMSRGAYDRARTILESADPQFDADPLYHSLFGRVCYVRGDVARATEELTQAVELKEINPRARLFLAVCQAMRGDQPAMERQLDQLEAERREGYGEARREIQAWLNRLKGGFYVSSAEQSLHRERIINLRLADAAIDARQNRVPQADQALAELAKEYPDFVGAATRRGLLAERKNRKEDALRFYRQEADRLFLAAYKVTTLDPAANLTSESALLTRFPTTRVFEARAMNATTGDAAERGWCLSTTAELTRTFAIDSTGRYVVDLIARGDQVNGIWPIVIVYLDGRGITQQYINSPVWDVFEIRQPLLAGRHTIRLLYANAAVLTDSTSRRSFYLDRVIIRPESN